MIVLFAIFALANLSDILSMHFFDVDNSVWACAQGGWRRRSKTVYTI